MNQYIIYTRVSSKKQGQSGLSLEAQKAKCKDFVNMQGGEVLATYSEVESGYRERTRPELNAALAKCKATGATLLIWELDRLGRRVQKLYEILESSGVNVVIGSQPEINAFLRHLYMGIAEEESRIRSQRIKRALQIKKQRGETWQRGSGSLEKVALMNEAAREKARNNPHTLHAADYVRILRQSNLSLRAIADRLNRSGYKTPSGLTGKFTATTVRNLLARIEA
jgi:DNA invertase Pin-like site-specific DNA recombinase